MRVRDGVARAAKAIRACQFECERLTVSHLLGNAAAANASPVRSLLSAIVQSSPHYKPQSLYQVICAAALDQSKAAVLDCVHRPSTVPVATALGMLQRVGHGGLYFTSCTSIIFIHNGICMPTSVPHVRRMPAQHQRRRVSSTGMPWSVCRLACMCRGPIWHRRDSKQLSIECDASHRCLLLCLGYGLYLTRYHSAVSTIPAQCRRRQHVYV